MIKTGLYIKNNCYYVVLGTARDVNTQRQLVVYYLEGGNGGLLTLPEDQFDLEMVREIVFNRRKYSEMI